MLIFFSGSLISSRKYEVKIPSVKRFEHEMVDWPNPHDPVNSVPWIHDMKPICATVVVISDTSKMLLGDKTQRMAKFMDGYLGKELRHH